jgi:hypothetical protein
MSALIRVHAGKILRQDARNARRQRLARSPWESGPHSVLEALLEVETSLEAILERYARIHAHISRALGADALRPQIHPIKISHSVTSDGPDGQPWPPPDRNTLWAVVRRVGGCTLWRAIQLAQVGSASPDVCNFPRQQMTSQRRIPPCGRGLSSSSWCEVEIVQGVWTWLACNSIAPGNITAEFV